MSPLFPTRMEMWPRQYRDEWVARGLSPVAVTRALYDGARELSHLFAALPAGEIDPPSLSAYLNGWRSVVARAHAAGGPESAKTTAQYYRSRAGNLRRGLMAVGLDESARAALDVVSEMAAMMADRPVLPGGVRTGIKRPNRRPRYRTERWPAAYREAWQTHSGQLGQDPKVKQRAVREISHLLAAIPAPFLEDGSLDAYLDRWRAQLRAAKAVGEGEHRTLANRLYHRAGTLRDGLEVIEPGRFALPVLNFFFACGRIVRGAKPKKAKRKIARKVTLPLSEWPTQARAEWELAISKAPSTDSRPGPMAHLAESTIKARFENFARWQRWLKNTGRAGFNKENLEAFVTNLESQKLASVTRANIVFNALLTERDLMTVRTGLRQLEDFGSSPKQRRAAPKAEDFGNATKVRGRVLKEDFGTKIERAAAGDPALGWAFGIVKRLSSRAEPVINKRALRVELGDLVRHGVDLLERARGMRRGRESAIRYRTGLQLLFLGLRCVRLSNLHEIRLPGRQSPVAPAFGALDLSSWPGYAEWPAGRVKNRREFRTRLPEAVRIYLDIYLAEFRPILLGGGDSDALWISSEFGRLMTKTQIWRQFGAAMEERFHRWISPHRVRDINAAWVAETMPDQMWIASGLLGHDSPGSIAAYLPMAEQISGQQQLESEIDDLLREHGTVASV